MRHPKYPPGLTGEEANELICLAEHHIAAGSEITNRFKPPVGIKFQARTKPDKRTHRLEPIKVIPAWVLYLVALFVSFGVTGIIFALTILFCG